MANRANIGSLKTLSITPYFVEPAIGTITVPTAMSTGSPQYSITFNKAQMAPSFTGNAGVVSYKPCLGYNFSGQNTTGATATLYYQINKNGSSYKSGSISIANGNYWTISMIDGAFLNDGDVFDLYIWCSVGVTFFYCNYYVVPSRVDTGAKYLYNYTVWVTSLMLSGLITTGKAANGWTGVVYLQQGQYTNYTTPNAGLGNGEQVSTGNTNNGAKSVIYPLFQPHPQAKLFQLQGGDATTGFATYGNSSTAYPSLQQPCYPTQIQYREIFFRD